MYDWMTDDHLVNRIKYVKRNFHGFEAQKEAGLFKLMAEAATRRLKYA